jgi:hypothetical protein
MLPKTVVVTFALLAALWPPPIVTNDGSPQGSGPALLADPTASPNTSAEERTNPLLALLVHTLLSYLD